MKYVIALLAVLLVVTAPVSSLPPARGDEQLASKVAPFVSENRMIAVMSVDTDVSYALIESTFTTPYEVDTLTELFTVELFYQAERRGEVTADTQLGSLIDVADSPAASVTLRELLEQKGGFANTEAESLDYEELLSIAQNDPLERRGEYQESNIGVALLGHALAEASKADFSTLFRTRFTGPMGMTNTRLRNDNNALAPANGGVTTIQDLGRFGRYAAMTDHWGDEQWVRTGRMPDFQSALAVEPNKRAVVVLSRGDESVEQAALEVLK